MNTPLTITLQDKTVAKERRMRLLMDYRVSDTAEKQFWAILHQKFPEETGIPARIRMAWNFTSQIDYRHGNLPSRIYLNHPLRVASIIANEVPDATCTTLIIALLHNLLEVSSVTSEEIGIQFGDEIAAALKALTIDRNRKDKSYLKEYYSRIEATSVACAEVKIADKMDNIYMICFNQSQEIRSSYLDEIDEWVIPMAFRVAPGLGRRMKEASTIIRQQGFLEREDELEQILREEQA